MASETTPSPNNVVKEKTMVVLKSSDDHLFEVDAEVASMMETINNFLNDDVAHAFPLPNVDSNVLAKVIEYCTKHVNLDNAAQNSHVLAWDKNFVNVDIDVLFDYILAADYLNIKGLLKLACEAIADYIKDKSVEEVRSIFNIVSDFTPDEEAEIMRANAWAYHN